MSNKKHAGPCIGGPHDTYVMSAITERVPVPIEPGNTLVIQYPSLDNPLDPIPYGQYVWDGMQKGWKWEAAT